MPRAFKILLRGAGHSGERLRPTMALDTLYLGDARFYLIIDVAVVEVGPRIVTVFVRASGHWLGRWDRTWNDPPGSGPFKQLLAEHVNVMRE